MAERIFPTKGNLIQAKKTLALCRLGYELLDRKRNILIREMMLLTDRAKELRGEIESTYIRAYAALQEANITLGVITKAASAVPIETGVEIAYRSVMGVELPQVTVTPHSDIAPYGFLMSNATLDAAYVSFGKVLQITAVLAEVENSVYRLSAAIKTTQRRANALKNILIPQYEQTVKYITDSLDEKEREDFSRLKVIKVQKRSKEQRKAQSEAKNRQISG